MEKIALFAPMPSASISRDRSEERIPAQGAKPITQVASQVVEPRQTALIAHRLHRLRHTPGPDCRYPPGGLAALGAPAARPRRPDLNAAGASLTRARAISTPHAGATRVDRDLIATELFRANRDTKERENGTPTCTLRGRRVTENSDASQRLARRRVDGGLSRVRADVRACRRSGCSQTRDLLLISSTCSKSKAIARRGTQWSPRCPMVSTEPSSGFARHCVRLSAPRRRTSRRWSASADYSSF